MVSAMLSKGYYNDAIMSATASQITSLVIVYSTMYSRNWSKKTSKLRLTGLCVGNSLVTGEFPAQMASNAENVSIWWRHHVSFWKILVWPGMGVYCDGPSLHCAKNRQVTLLSTTVDEAYIIKGLNELNATDHLLDPLTDHPD